METETFEEFCKINLNAILIIWNKYLLAGGGSPRKMRANRRL